MWNLASLRTTRTERCIALHWSEPDWIALKWMEVFSAPEWVIVRARSSTGGSLTHSQNWTASFSSCVHKPLNSKPPLATGSGFPWQQWAVSRVRINKSWFEVLELCRKIQVCTVCVRCCVYPWVTRLYVWVCVWLCVFTCPSMSVRLYIFDFDCVCVCVCVCVCMCLLYISCARVSDLVANQPIR